MKLTTEFAQSIVEKVRSVVPFDVNITDSNSIIVGATDTSRIGSFHSVSAEILASGQGVDVPEGRNEVPPGSRPGTGLPVMFRGKPIGVIGMTGNPGEVRQYVRIAKELVELMLEREALLEQLRLEAMARESFARNLVAGEIGEDDPWRERANLLGIDMNVIRTVIAIEADRLQKKPSSSADATPASGEFSAPSRGIKTVLCDVVGSIFNHPQDMRLEIGNERLAILTCVEKLSGKARAKKLESLVREVGKRALNRLGVTVTIGVSNECLKICEYNRAYKEAIDALVIGKRLYGSGRVYYFASLKLGKLVAALQSCSGKEPVEEVFRRLNNESDDSLIKTLECFFENGMNVTKTAQALHVHRNTVQYRFNRIKELTGCDLRYPDDLALLRLALLHARLNIYTKK